MQVGFAAERARCVHALGAHGVGGDHGSGRSTQGHQQWLEAGDPVGLLADLEQREGHAVGVAEGGKQVVLAPSCPDGAARALPLYRQAAKPELGGAAANHEPPVDRAAQANAIDPDRCDSVPEKCSRPAYILRFFDQCAGVTCESASLVLGRCNAAAGRRAGSGDLGSEFGVTAPPLAGSGLVVSVGAFSEPGP